MQPAVERAVVRVAGWSMAVLSGVYLVLAIRSDGWAWWILFGELVVLTTVAFLQVMTGRVSLVILWILVVAVTTLSGHLVMDPHRAGTGMAVAAVAAIGWVLVEQSKQKRVLLAMALLWAAQAVFPGSRDWLMVYEAAIFVALSIGLRSIGTAMRVSQDRYQRLFEQAPIALWEEDFSHVDRWLHGLRRSGIRDLRSYLKENPDEIDRALALVDVLHVNQAAAELIEVEDASALQGPIDPATYTPETRPAFLEQVMAVWEGQSELTTELEGRTVTGRPIRAIMQWVAPTGTHGTADYGRVVVSIHDVSELKAAQRDLTETLEALVGRERQLRTVVSGAPVVLFAFDADGVFTVAEGAGLKNLGQYGYDIVGTSCFERNANSAGTLDDIRRALAGEEVMSVSEMNGRIWEVRRNPTFGSDGVVDGVIGVATDVTERHQMEQALEGARHRNRLMIRNISDVLFTIDTGRVDPFHPVPGEEG